MKLANGSDPSNLPFDGFKWRWATLTPTESLNEPDLFLGVLRAMYAAEGVKANSPKFNAGLASVAADLKSPVNLVRTANRNIIRNSGQYWKAVGVLESTQPGIVLTDLGRGYANRDITQQEFATRVVAGMTLPSPVYSAPDRLLWENHGLSIRPLLLLLVVIAGLGRVHAAEGYLTVPELVKVIQPLSGHNAAEQEYVDAVLEYREGTLSTVGWASVLTEANDSRMAREFLLFLQNYGMLSAASETRTDGFPEIRFRLESISADLVGELKSAPMAGSIIGARVDEIALEVQRERVLREVLNRPGQGMFRKRVLAASGGVCLVTGTSIEGVLEAAHIKPVSKHGSDHVSNGLCLRSDIHALFDAGRIAIRSDGAIFSDTRLATDFGYAALPSAVTIPSYVSPLAIDWRWNYS